LRVSQRELLCELERPTARRRRSSCAFTAKTSRAWKPCSLSAASSGCRGLRFRHEPRRWSGPSVSDGRLGGGDQRRRFRKLGKFYPVASRRVSAMRLREGLRT
jgi:hypothetical protein